MAETQRRRAEQGSYGGCADSTLSAVWTMVLKWFSIASGESGSPKEQRTMSRNAFRLAASAQTAISSPLRQGEAIQWTKATQRGNTVDKSHTERQYSGQKPHREAIKWTKATQRGNTVDKSHTKWKQTKNKRATTRDGPATRRVHGPTCSHDSWESTVTLRAPSENVYNTSTRVESAPAA